MPDLLLRGCIAWPGGMGRHPSGGTDRKAGPSPTIQSRICPVARLSTRPPATQRGSRRANASKRSLDPPRAVANPVSYAGDEKGRWEPPGVAPVDGPRDPAPTHGIMGAAIDLGPARRKTDGDVLEDRPCEEPDAQPTPSISSGHEPPRGVRRFARARYRLGHGPARGPPRQSTPAGMPPRRPSGG